MSRRIVAGIDSSTQSTKVLRVDAGTGEVLGATAAPHPDGTSVDPEAWWGALTSQAALDGVAALSVSAQQHGMVALDDTGAPVHDALLWNDVRSAPQSARLRERFAPTWWARELGVVPVSSFTVTKLAWLAEERPDLADRVQRVLLPHDWLTWRLLGRPNEATTDRSDASGTGYWSVPEGRYRPDVLTAAFGRDVDLPTVLGPAASPGVTAEGAVVGVGCGDNAGAALGLGLDEGEVVVSVGTSGTVFASTSHQVRDPSGAVAGFADATGGSLPLLATLNAARILSSTAHLLGVDLDTLDRLATDAPPDAGGLTFVPYLDGERTPDLPGATGTMRGLTRTTLTPEHVARAAVLGLACMLGDAMGHLAAQGVRPRRVVLIGGGAASTALRQALADVLGTEVDVPAANEYVALGAARQAAWALDPDAGWPAWARPTAAVVAPRDQPWVAEVRQRFAAVRLDTYGG